MIKELKLILEILQSVGVDEAVIEPNGDDGSRIRAANKDGNIVIFDDIEFAITEFPMGIQSVRGLLSRINLFDTDKASVETEDDGKTVRDMVIKQGRKKASFRFANPARIMAPTSTPDSTPSDVLTFSEEYVQYLVKAIAAMSFTGNKEERTISIHGDGEALNIRISDGEDDAFNEVLEDIEVETERGSWEVTPFQRVMNKASEYNPNKEANFVIDSFGVVTFSLEHFNVMIVPMAS